MPKKKSYLMIKRGLIIDPKHRRRMGKRIWLYMCMIDRVDWETGEIYDWKDKDEGADMSASWRTIERQRQELATFGYITCEQNGGDGDGSTGLKIKIHNWTNPRNYSGEVINQKSKDTQNCVASDEAVTQAVSTKLRSPTLDSNIKYKISRETPPREPSEVYAIALSLSEVCKMDMQANKGRLLREAKLILTATPHPTPDLVRENYNGDPGAFWKSTDWRGKKGNLPTPASIRETWGQWANQAEEKSDTSNILW